MPEISMNVFTTCAVAVDGTLTAKHRHSNECRNKVRMVISWLIAVEGADVVNRDDVGVIE
jgi:hypothetical protein